MINGKIHYKWSFSIAMLNYQRVQYSRDKPCHHVTMKPCDLVTLHHRISELGHHHFFVQQLHPHSDRHYCAILLAQYPSFCGRTTHI